MKLDNPLECVKRVKWLRLFMIILGCYDHLEFYLRVRHLVNENKTKRWFPLMASGLIRDYTRHLWNEIICSFLFLSFVSFHTFQSCCLVVIVAWLSFSWKKDFVVVKIILLMKISWLIDIPSQEVRLQCLSPPICFIKIDIN